MNNVLASIERQIGKKTFYKNYDVAIQKLVCIKGDEYKISNENSTDPPILACRFAETPGYKHIAALVNEDGEIALQDVTEQGSIDGVPSTISSRVGHHNAIFDLAWKTNEMKLVTASGDHTIRLWDINQSEMREERMYVGHTRSVKTVAFQKNSSVFASGGRDSLIYIWDTRAFLPAMVAGATKADSAIDCSQILRNPKLPKKRSKASWFCPSRMNSITGVVFQNDFILISCSAGDGTIRCWDMRKTYCINNRQPAPKYTLPYYGSSLRRGYTNLLVDHTTLRLYASCLDNNIYCYNIGTYTTLPIMVYSGHETTNSFYVKSSLSPDSLYLLSGSSNEKAYIWNVQKKEPIVILNGHEAEVTCVAWCDNKDITIITCTDDAHHKVWRIRDDYSLENEIIGRAKSYSTELDERKNTKKVQSYLHTLNAVDVVEPEPKRARYFLEKIEFKESTSNCEEENFEYSMPTKKPRKLFSDETCLGSDVNSLATMLEGNSINEEKNDSQLIDIINNLPNFAIDGTAPHLRIISPVKRKENKDWISVMRKRKEILQRMTEENIAGPSSPKIRKMENTVNNKQTSTSTIKTPTRRLSKLVETSPRAQSPLLKYFKITASSNGNSKSTHDCSDNLLPLNRSFI